MGVVVRGLSLVSLSFIKVIPPHYGDMWGVYKYNGSTSLLRAERWTNVPTYPSRAKPSRAEPSGKPETFPRVFWKHHPPLRNQITFLRPICCVWPIITLNPQTSKIFLYLCHMNRYKDLDGLRVEHGRLINDGYPSETGIARAARIKSAVKSANKVNQIAEGIELAETRKSFKGFNF